MFFGGDGDGFGDVGEASGEGDEVVEVDLGVDDEFGAVRRASAVHAAGDAAADGEPFDESGDFGAGFAGAVGGEVFFE